MFLLKRVNCDFTVELTGFAIGAEVSCARVAVAASSATGSSNPVRFIAVLLRLQSARSILLHSWDKQGALRRLGKRPQGCADSALRYRGQRKKAAGLRPALQGTKEKSRRAARTAPCATGDKGKRPQGCADCALRYRKRCDSLLF